MKKDLSRKILCSILAAGLCGTASFALAANSGGEFGKIPEGHGGYYDAYVGNNGTSSDNNVYFDDNYDNYVVGGFAESGNANNNTVVVSGCSVQQVYGGWLLYTVHGSTNNNKVLISNSTVDYVMGGCAYAWGESNNNTVVISGSTVNRVYGGYSETESISKDNSVVIIDSTVNGAVYGGYNSGEYGTVQNNSVAIEGNSDLSKADIYGGGRGYFEATIEGNKLILVGFNGGDKTVKSLNNFDSIEVKALANDQEYNVGESYNVISTTTEMDTDNVKVGNAEQTALIGVARKADGTVSIDGSNQNIAFKINDMRINEQTAITTEARAGVTAFVNQGAEVVADNLNMLSQSAEGINTFATVSGNNSKYDTGSYADINGWNSIIGIANTKEIGKDKLNYGAFFENGSGNYNTYNEIGGASFRGDGNVLYNGGGVMVRLDKENGFYTEAAVRAGSVKNEAGKNLSDGQHTYDYETENAYYGGHIGIGKIFKLDNGKAWDVYGKYFHMHHEGDSVEIGKDTFDFDSVDSNKLRIGARFSEQQGEKLTSYYGLAWDYEFSGDVSGTAAGYDMHTPSLEGSTVIGEVGFRYTPGKESPWYFDANVKGYVGMQEGLSGSVQAVYSF